MFDGIGWSEMAVVALLALLVIGPKDLPKVMRTAAQWVRKARGVTREFQSGINDMIREAELEDAKKSIQAVSGGDPKKTITDTIDPTGSVTEAMKEVDRDARKSGEESQPTPSLESGAADSDAPDEGPTIAKTEASVAPPHSVVPPEDPFKTAGDVADKAAAAEPLPEAAQAEPQPAPEPAAAEPAAAQEPKKSAEA